MVIHPGGAAVQLGIAAARAGVHPDVAVVRTDRDAGEYGRRRELMLALVVQARRQRRDRTHAAGGLVTVEPRSEAEEQVLGGCPLDLGGGGEAGAAIDPLVGGQVQDIAL